MRHEQSELHFCKGCATAELAAEAISLIGEYIASLKVEECVLDAEYAQRQAVCSRCTGLVNGITCAYCGCLVLVRAKRKAMRCPDPSGDRWLLPGD